MASGGSRTVTGVFTGTGADMTIKTPGIRPRHVVCVNVTSLDREEWIDDMAADSAVKQVAAGTSTLIVTNGITPRADGFEFGADADMNVAGEIVRYVVSD